MSTKVRVNMPFQEYPENPIIEYGLIFNQINMLIRNFRFFLLCSLSIAFLFSCSSDFSEREALQEEASKRDISEVAALPIRCMKTGEQTQVLDLRGKNFLVGNAGMEGFLEGLDFNFSVLCKGKCGSSEKCTVTNLRSHTGSDVSTIPGAGTNQFIKGIEFKSSSQDSSEVTLVLSATCKCKPG